MLSQTFAKHSVRWVGLWFHCRIRSMLPRYFFVLWNMACGNGRGVRNSQFNVCEFESLASVTHGHGHHGVGVAINKRLLQQINSICFSALSSRVCQLQFSLGTMYFSCIAIYFPRTWHSEDDVEHVYTLLGLLLGASVMDGCILVLGGDCNACIGPLANHDALDQSEQWGGGRENERGRLFSLYKACAFLILGQLEALLEAHQPEEQHGFQNADCNMMVLDNAWDKGIPVSIMTLDLSKVFHNASWNALWFALVIMSFLTISFEFCSWFIPTSWEKCKVNMATAVLFPSTPECDKDVCWARVFKMGNVSLKKKRKHGNVVLTLASITVDRSLVTPEIPSLVAITNVMLKFRHL